MIDFAISRAHAVVELRREGYVLTDAGSANGTFVNGVRVSGEGSRLQDGDQVRFARYEFSFLSAGALFDLFKART
jgi:pSer/pThr/pTyr-binding forkhead associated (FHA) protein